jgi:hypothetical protein
MKQHVGRMARRPDKGRFEALTGTGTCSYFVPPAHQGMEQMAVVHFGRPKARSAQVNSREQRLDCAAQIGLGERVHAWRGASGQRYVVSVYPADAAPDYEDAVVLHIARASDSRRILRIVDDRDCVFDEPGDADEIHVHLMARGAAARAALIADLLAG